MPLLMYLNELRKHNPNKWVFFTCLVVNNEGAYVRIEYKAFDQYVQVLRINGVDFALGHTCESSVKAWKAGIASALDRNQIGFCDYVPTEMARVPV